LSVIKRNYDTLILNTNTELTAYDRASSNLITYQGKTAGQLQGINDILNVERAKALKDIANKKRMVQINTYYSDKYADYIFIAKLVVLLCAIIIVLSMLVRRSIISNGIYSLLIIISCVILIIIIIGRWVSMGYRDPVDYKQYKFYVPPYKPADPDAVAMTGYSASMGMAINSDVSGDSSGSSGGSSGSGGFSGSGSSGSIYRGLGDYM
jgi:uncharacterized membrane protein YgcG